jgi:Putative prokaryotic signal transducing protein
MADLERLTVVGSEMEAQMICAFLGTAGIEAFQRQTSTGAGSGGGMPQAGAHEVLVASDDLERAREVLESQPEAT